MQTFKTKSPMEGTYDETIRDTIENGHDVNFIFSYSTGVRVEVLYDDIPLNVSMAKKHVLHRV